MSDFSTLPELLAHARREGATHVLSIDDETHVYFRRRDGSYEKAEAWQKDGYWHTQAPGSRAVVPAPPRGAQIIGAGEGGKRMVEDRRRGPLPVDRDDTRRAVSMYTDADVYVNGVYRMRVTITPSTTIEDAAATVAMATPVDGTIDVIQGENVWSFRNTENGIESIGHRFQTLTPITNAIASWNNGDAYRDGSLRTLIDAGLVEWVQTRDRSGQVKGWNPTEEGIAQGLRTADQGEVGGYTRERTGMRKSDAGSDESRGEAYADEQLQSDYFQDWIRGQMADGAKLAPEERIPLETPADFKRLARRMLQDLEFDTRRQRGGSKEFFDGMRRRLNDKSTIEWLAEELQHIKEER